MTVATSYRKQEPTMCGIAGLLNLRGAPLTDASVVTRMASYLSHRGPDDDGSLRDGPVAFGFRRLSIIDLETGHQPVSNEDGTVWVMLNGEIYNFVELRTELEKQGHVFRTETDTEVIAHAYESYGLDFVDHLRGMFAIALWDSPKQRLVLARDRIGKKPLFYGVRGNQLAFASEVKALLAWPQLNRSINARALHDYFTFLYVPAPDSIFENVYKLPAAHLLVADCHTGSFSLHRYWRISPEPDRTKPLSFYVEGLREVLSEAVRLRLRSDVPLGAFLSGGIDSSVVVGLMSREVSPVRTFSIGFPDKRFDETAAARLVATSHGTIHKEEIFNDFDISPEEFRDLVWYMDEPFADSSFLPTYWVSKVARRDVTVALSGDGGDELFAGHTRYRYFQLLNRLRSSPDWLNRAGKNAAGGLRNLVTPLSTKLAERLRQTQKALELSALSNNEQIFTLATYFDEAGKRSLYDAEWSAGIDGYASRERLSQVMQPVNDAPLASILAWDFETNLVDDCLVKVDRASMACSLEVRSPFLDHRVAEFAMKIPPEYKLRNGVHKYVLKRAFADLLPEKIVNRRKQGFEVPFARWFQKEPWRSFLLDMLAEDRLRSQGIFDFREVIRLRDQFLRDPQAQNLGLSAYQLRHRVWMLFVFQVWYDQFMKASVIPAASCFELARFGVRGRGASMKTLTAVS